MHGQRNSGRPGKGTPMGRGRWVRLLEREEGSLGKKRAMDGKS
uniref:Uncharacterized protein n=1 Tax=Arundo donax TaxID=35708 RepID=A0A0A9AZS2_ARUDO